MIQDLNLLLVFDALMVEHHVGRARAACTVRNRR
jgi:hypothetical protein